MAARDVSEQASESPIDDLASEFSREGRQRGGGSLFDETIPDEELLGNINDFLDVLKEEKEGDELVDFDILFGEDRPGSEELEVAPEEPATDASGPPVMRHPSKDALLKTLVSTPAIICDLFNAGNLDKLQTFLESAFSEDMTLLTDPLRAPVTGRHHYFTFLKGLSEAFPDSVMTMIKSSLTRANKVVFTARFSGTLLIDQQPVPEGSHLFRSASLEIADIVEKNAPRRLLAAEKKQLKQAEALVKAGGAYPHITSYVTGKYSIRKGPALAGEERPPVVGAQIMWKVRGFTVLPISKFS